MLSSRPLLLDDSDPRPVFDLRQDAPTAKALGDTAKRISLRPWRSGKTSSFMWVAGGVGAG